MNPNRRNRAFARVVSNLMLGGSATWALIAMMRIWSREHEERDR